MKKGEKFETSNDIAFLYNIGFLGRRGAVAQKAHPYLFYTPERISRLKERIKTDTLLGNSWKAVEQRCGDWVSSNKGGDIEQLAFAFTMTGDKSYAERAKALLMDIVSKKNGTGWTTGHHAGMQVSAPVMPIGPLP